MLHPSSQIKEHAPESSRQGGFTLIELIMVLVIAGILAVFVAPRFFDANIFKARGFADQAQAAMRYAQKIAIAQRRLVCVAVTAPTATSARLDLAIAVSNAATSCATPLALPASSSNFIQSSDATTSAANFVFDALGRPFALPYASGNASVGQTVTVAGYAIKVEKETGYVHQ
ncbi:MAG TPA: prepilin-type N-terminal cleavage/methylation domain-containing protein [Gallionella sp.]|nr:prepilin-type N-terminal cleavage/methylation domain-containing protein [Gallionella sp.]